MKDQAFHFEGLDDMEVQALSSLQVKLFSPTVVAFPSPAGRYMLDTNALHNHISCVLLRRQLGKLAKPVRYWP